MKVKEFADKNNLNLDIYCNEGENVSVCLGEYQYDCIFQRDGSVYNMDFDIYHSNIDEYHEWIINDYLEAIEDNTK